MITLSTEERTSSSGHSVPHPEQTELQETNSAEDGTSSTGHSLPPLQPMEEQDCAQDGNYTKKEKKVKQTADLNALFAIRWSTGWTDTSCNTRTDCLTEKHRRSILDVYRTKNAPSKKVIYDCLTCFRRFTSLVTHKHVNKCECSNVQKVTNPESRSSLPQEIRVAVKSSILPSKRDLERAQNFVDYRNNPTKCSGKDKKWSQDRHGIVQLMAHMFSMTVCLKKN